jgi:hypothetical protein
MSTLNIVGKNSLVLDVFLIYIVTYIHIVFACGYDLFDFHDPLFYFMDPQCIMLVTILCLSYEHGYA